MIFIAKLEKESTILKRNSNLAFFSNSKASTKSYIILFGWICVLSGFALSHTKMPTGYVVLSQGVMRPDFPLGFFAITLFLIFMVGVLDRKRSKSQRMLEEVNGKV